MKDLGEFYGKKGKGGMSLHSLLYEWDLERVVMCMSDWKLSAWMFADLVAEGPKRSLKRETINRMMAACLGTKREVGSEGICSLHTNFVAWKYPMRYGNHTKPQHPLPMGVYTLLRELGLLHGRGPTLHDTFASTITHAPEVFTERWVETLRSWKKKVEAVEGSRTAGPAMIRPIMANFEDELALVEEDDDSVEDMVGGRSLEDLPGGEDRRGSVSETAQKHWKDSYSSRRQRALDLAEWEALHPEMRDVFRNELNEGGMNPRGHWSV